MRKYRLESHIFLWQTVALCPIFTLLHATHDACLFTAKCSCWLGTQFERGFVIDLSLQRYSSTLSQGFKENDLGNSPGCWADSVATYCSRRPSQLSAKNHTKTLRQSGWIALYVESLREWRRRKRTSPPPSVTNKPISAAERKNGGRIFRRPFKLSNGGPAPCIIRLPSHYSLTWGQRPQNSGYWITCNFWMVSTLKLH